MRRQYPADTADNPARLCSRSIWPFDCRLSSPGRAFVRSGRAVRVCGRDNRTKEFSEGLEPSWHHSLQSTSPKLALSPNEAVEKVPTRKKVSELGVPKWSPGPRSSLIGQIRRSFFFRIFRSTFFYRLNVAGEPRGVYCGGSTRMFSDQTSRTHRDQAEHAG